MMKKLNRAKIFGLACIATLSIGLMTGCGSSDDAKDTTPATTESSTDTSSKTGDEGINSDTKPNEAPDKPAEVAPSSEDNNTSGSATNDTATDNTQTDSSATDNATSNTLDSTTDSAE